MKRDMELVRKILLYIEENYKSNPIRHIDIDGYSDKEIIYHCELLDDAGYLNEFEEIPWTGGVNGITIKGLSWYGHEFLDTIRNDTVWSKTKETITKNGLSATVEVVKNVATEILSIMTQAAIKGLTP